jgi:hypothetical protein
MIFFWYGIRNAGLINMYSQVDKRVNYVFNQKFLKKTRVFKLMKKALETFKAKLTNFGRF